MRAGVLLVLCDFSQSVPFCDLISVSKSSTDEHHMVQYHLCAIPMQKIQKFRWEKFVYVQDSFCLFLAHV